MATPTVVLLPVWGAGHLTPMLEAGRRLLSCRGDRALSLTVLVMPPPSQQQAAEVEAHLRREEEAHVNVRFLRLPAVEPPTDHQGPVEFVSRVVRLHLPHVRAALSTLGSSVAAILLDLFCTETLDVARDLAIPSYIYFTCNAAALSFFLRLPALCAEVDGEFAAMDGAVDLPGLPPVPPSALPVIVMDRTKPCCDWYAYHGRRFTDADGGVVVNTAADLEPRALAAVAAGRCCAPGVPPPKLYPVGPVISFGPSPPPPDDECMRWLDAQPPGSVAFLCFGSGGYFTAAQAHAAARGLERSGHRFLWVLRGPPASPPHDRRPTDGDLAELLPEGFLARTKHRGLVWPTTAPQKAVLAHGAVGGFVTHCGWNSVLEALWHGVPMATWPRYAEQHLNAFALVADVGAAVAMDVDRERDNFVEAAELERAVRALMGGESEEGRKAREKAKEMMAKCRRAVEDGGSSAAALKRLCDDIVFNSKCTVALKQSS
ncbi:hypothetical protein PR202_ga28352 [Eleusine coracana subsp. coracana]|uniref:Malvidin galactosylase UGT88C3 n=1 Tax=Eleusine coracana subsp. coracana TaxID=191504 RepID=A0AAV5DH56_ELECO|nr:hypothetical protein QOZ80_7AG0555770 [Eleusine coracana subsp. coracana]GJN10273.1 hypothetical protein PR202_ga28352 [Eleusine coracana subsp. coracana]